MANRVGQQLGNYRLIRWLGDGGFAEVYLGEQIFLGTQAAIKVLLAQLTKQDEEKFREEARTIARLIHPHIVRVLEFGIERGSPFLVMDYAPNGTLHDRHPKGAPLPLNVVVSYTRQMADALQYAHDEKLIHRDIKPENMLVGRRNEVLLSDFGIAVVAHSTRTQIKQDVIGTVDYMAPEQIKAYPVIASDQYALGCVVYEWLAGTPPFEGTEKEVAVKHLSVPPTPLRAKLPTIPLSVEQVLLKALEKDPQKRFASVQEFATALEQASGLQVAPTPPRPASTQRVGTLLCKYTGHSEGVAAVAWSPDGNQIASVDRSVQIWDATSGKLIVNYANHIGVVRGIAWSPDGKWIASAGDDKTVQVWDAATGKHEFTYAGHFHMVSISTAAWSPDGTLVASSSYDGTVQIWDMFSGFAIFTYRANPNTWPAVAWSPDGTRIAFAGSGPVQVWDTATGSPVVTCAGHAPDANAGGRDGFFGVLQVVTYYAGHVPDANVVWSPDGTRIASVGGRRSAVQVWNATTGRHIFTCNDVYGMTWSPDGTYIATWGRTKANKTVQVWDAAIGRHIFSYAGHVNQVNSVTWSPGAARIASGSYDGTVQVWNATTGGDVFTYRGHAGPVTNVLWSPDGTRIASVGNDQRKQNNKRIADTTVQVWVAG